jgi:bacterioferritin
MDASPDVVKVLNGLLTIELRAISQYFLDAKLAQHWGFERLAERFRADSFDEMRDAESLMDRILLLGGLPNLQRIDAFQTGESVAEQFEAAHDLEHQAVTQLRAAIVTCEEAGDSGTAQLLRTMLLDEEGQLDWLASQIQLMETIGEANYLAQQVRS